MPIPSANAETDSDNLIRSLIVSFLGRDVLAIAPGEAQFHIMRDPNLVDPKVDFITPLLKCKGPIRHLAPFWRHTQKTVGMLNYGCSLLFGSASQAIHSSIAITKKLTFLPASWSAIEFKTLKCAVVRHTPELERRDGG